MGWRHNDKNPFIDKKSHTSVYAYLKSILLFPLALIRIILLIIIFIIYFILSCICSKNTLPIVTQYICKIMLYCFGFFDVQVINKEQFQISKKANAIAVYNHVSIIDTLLQIAYIHPFSFAINSYHSKISFIKQYLDKLDCIEIDHKKQNQIGKIIEHVAAHKNMLAIAPEGTLSNGHALLKFRTGAFVPMTPIQPIVIKYPHDHCNPAWVCDVSIFTIIYRLATQFHNNATLELLPTMYPRDDENPKQFSDRVRLAMAKALNVPTIEQGQKERLATDEIYKY